MSGADTIRNAEAGVAEAELALGALQQGLGVAETVVDASGRARLTLRGLVKLAIIVVIVVGIVEGIRRSRSSD